MFVDGVVESFVVSAAPTLKVFVKVDTLSVFIVKKNVCFGAETLASINNNSNYYYLT